MADFIDVMRTVHLAKIKYILWYHLIDYLVLANDGLSQLNVADVVQDTKYGTDLILKLNLNLSKKFNIALRIRENHFAKNNSKRYYRDFTIRSKTRFNNYTEINKLLDGTTILNWYFYGWENDYKTAPGGVLLNIF